MIIKSDLNGTYLDKSLSPRVKRVCLHPSGISEPISRTAKNIEHELQNGLTAQEEIDSSATTSAFSRTCSYIDAQTREHSTRTLINSNDRKGDYCTIIVQSKCKSSLIVPLGSLGLFLTGGVQGSEARGSMMPYWLMPPQMWRWGSFSIGVRVSEAWRRAPPRGGGEYRRGGEDILPRGGGRRSPGKRGGGGGGKKGMPGGGGRNGGGIPRKCGGGMNGRGERGRPSRWKCCGRGGDTGKSTSSSPLLSETSPSKIHNKQSIKT
ncbi:unnamed protein product [Timema podura]|uniref:Uncharacterized protein n=1 Tax=Timema podura TaxID=61482 RepID=A0ABN7NXS2_TIMPD|nr:unnamed protein product [Timema podura]